MPANPIPDGYHAVTPYLTCRDAAAAIAFYKLAFGATETLRLTDAAGKVGHAEVRIGDCAVMLSDEFPEWQAISPQTLGGATCALNLYVPDVDAAYDRAIAAGATPIMPVADQFYGDRSGSVRDPFGHKWAISTHLEQVSPQEMQRRYDTMSKV